MCHSFTPSALAACTIVLLASGCSDITNPPADQRTIGPSFSHGGPSETTCTGLITGTHDNVTVPPGAACTVLGAMILGNVKALQDSRLNMGGTTVRGNIEGDRPDVIQIFDGSTVGNVFVTGAGAVPPPGAGLTTVFIGNGVTVTGGDVIVLKSSANGIIVRDVTLQKGTIKVEDNVVNFFLQIANNRVAQNLQVFKNQGSGSVTGNMVGANLQCFENGPPFVGGPNMAQKAEGQCF